MLKRLQHPDLHVHICCPTDVPTWLKSLRLHKYAALFSTMTYDEMMSLTEEQLEAQVCKLIKKKKVLTSLN